MRTLADLIAFNLANCDAEMTYLGQSVFEDAEATSGDSPIRSIALPVQIVCNWREIRDSGG
ncbi:MAG TPA: hypothetical protein VJ935_11615 [Acidimicrobiia bacterium]|nr:hypothetical protein [Acidimicrobiia bacterium]